MRQAAVPHLMAAGRLLALIAIVAAIAGCGADASPSGSGPAQTPGGSDPTLAGSAWIVVSVDGRSPVAGAVPTVMFDAERVNGTGGCNQFGGRYRLDPATGQVQFRELVSTDMGCVQAGVSAFEATFPSVDPGASSGEGRGGRRMDRSARWSDGRAPLRGQPRQRREERPSSAAQGGG